MKKLLLFLAACVLIFAVASAEAENVHQYTIVPEKSYAPSCLVEGLAYYECHGCGDHYTVAIPAVGHKPGDTVAETTLLPTCIRTGTKKITVYCKNCNAVISITTEALPMTDHTWPSSWTVIRQPICTTNGLEIKDCVVCGVRLDSRETAATSHAWGPWNTVAPTCTADGYQYRVCDNNSSHTEWQADILALGHDWGETTYTWVQDRSTVTACRVCQRDETHIQQETVTVSAEVVQEPTCEELGCTEYTSLPFADPAFSVQSMTETVLALGHDWMQVNTIWGVNFSTVTVKRVCRRDISHKVTETAQTKATVIVAADCENNGLMSYSAEFLQPEFQDYTAEFFAEIPALGHEWCDPVYEWSQDGRSVTASRVCSRDPSHIETETAYAAVTVITSPTMSDDGLAGITAPVFNNPAFSAMSQGSVVLPALGTLDLLLLPTGTQAIEDEVFAGGSFEAIILPDGCVSIGGRAFAGCENLLYVKIPASVTEIAPDAFDGCPNVIIDQSGE